VASKRSGERFHQVAVEGQVALDVLGIVLGETSRRSVRPIRLDRVERRQTDRQIGAIVARKAVGQPMMRTFLMPISLQDLG
jgi:hypothetical protein